MSKIQRHKLFGTAIEEWIEKVPGELSIDAVGLWQIVSSGREGFGLSGDGLVDFVRRCILTLTAKGARPVVGATDNVHIWTTVDYGQPDESAADAIISQWITSGQDPDAGGVWFALPHVYKERRGRNASEKSAHIQQDVTR